MLFSLLISRPHFDLLDPPYSFQMFLLFDFESSFLKPPADFVLFVCNHPHNFINFCSFVKIFLHKFPSNVVVKPQTLIFLLIFKSIDFRMEIIIIVAYRLEIYFINLIIIAGNDFLKRGSLMVNEVKPWIKFLYNQFPLQMMNKLFMPRKT